MEHGQISLLQIQVSWDGMVATVSVTGELDITTATILSRRLLKVGAAQPDRINLDLGGLLFVDVAGARALDEARSLLQTGCPVILRTPEPPARKVFELTGLMDGGGSASPSHGQGTNATAGAG